MKINVTFALDSELLNTFIEVVKENESTLDEEIAKAILQYAYGASYHNDKAVSVTAPEKNRPADYVPPKFIDAQKNLAHETYQRHSFEFDGHFYYSMGDLVFAVVKKYTENHPNITFVDLKKVFPDDWIGNFPYVIEKYALVNDESRHRRLMLSSGESIGITTQWKFENGSFGQFFNGVNQTLGEEYLIKIIS